MAKQVIVWKLRSGDRVMVRRGKKLMQMIVVAAWAKGEGNGYAMKLPGQKNHECVDISNSQIVSAA